jgi:quinohemoprotein ethanol dehydrogenase
MYLASNVLAISSAGKRSIKSSCAAAMLLSSVFLSSFAHAQEQAKNAALGDWPSHGLDYAETRFSKLSLIDTSNARNLSLAWTYNLQSTRGVEATPIVVDGVMYVTASWGVVYAIDAKTGQKKWSYDPQVPRADGYKACCDVVNRGVAFHEGKIFLASLDGRLIALDATNGAKVWEKDTINDHSHSYTITGAPRVYKGKVIIGNGGSEYGVRGYVTAYDAENGEQKWRWFVVPGDPSKPFENKSMEIAAQTWDPSGKYWIDGGGGAPWDSMAFDPELDLLYIGTGNGGPWNRNKRSPAGGDNLYLASIVALNPDTGEYVWHYQETPGDNWDYTSTQSIILTDIRINGKLRKVIIHAPKNGFFFVIDRTNGKFLSAKNFVDVNWTTGYDADGRPVVIPAARGDAPHDAIPGPFGGHNWPSMSFNPQTGLAYFPAQTIPLSLGSNWNWKFNGTNPGEPGAALGFNLATFIGAATSQKVFGRLIAWDAVAQKEVWRHDFPAPSNGGTLTTAGNLVFEGAADGHLYAFNAKTGEVLWKAATGVGVLAAPITYEVDGVQYVSIAVGWGGAFGLTHHVADVSAPGMVFTFALGGKATPPQFAKYQMEPLISDIKYDPADMQAGALIYVANCIPCHGLPAVDNGGAIHNLGYVPSKEIDTLESFVFKGPMLDQGMPDFTGKLTSDDVTKIKAFIAGTADVVRTQTAH